MPVRPNKRNVSDMRLFADAVEYHEISGLVLAVVSSPQ